jgi:DNA-binding transcriptional regulator PaaX
MRMGKLQGSVWISPRDMRPVYADMAEACGLEQHGVLFESRTVLGMEPRVIVDTAWNFDRIGASQQWFCRTAEDNLKRAAESPAPPEVLQALLREECAAYLAVMERDPLLPRELWPRDYRGVEALQTHRRFHQDMARLLADAAR